MHLLGRTALLAALLLLPVPSLRAQTAADPCGHWEGAIQAPMGEVVIEIDLARNSNGDLMGTFGNPAQNLRGYPLANVGVQGRSVSFELKANSGGGTFAGTFFSDGKSMAGDFTTQGFAIPFNLARTGDARIEPTPKSPAIGKELEGTWNSTLGDGPGQLGLVLKMSNQPDGTATGSILIEHGTEVPITIAQKASSVTLGIKTNGASISGTLNPDGTELVGTYNERSVVVPLTFRRAASTAAKQGQPPVFQLALVDRAGTIAPIGRLPPGTFAPRLSPDGRLVTFDTFDATIWIADIANIGTPRRFASGRFPMWSADGTRLLFAGPDGIRLFWQAADGSGSPEQLNDTARAPESWSTSAQLVTYITLKDNTDYDIWAFSPSDRKMRALVAQPTSAEMSSRFSPDGKWLAYQANDSGMHEVYVEPFPRTGVRTRVSSAGGQRPVWSPNGREIFYDLNGTLYAVAFQAEPHVEVGKATALPIKGFIQGTGRRLWDLTPDGKQFLVMLP